MRAAQVYHTQAAIEAEYEANMYPNYGPMTIPEEGGASHLDGKLPDGYYSPPGFSEPAYPFAFSGEVSSNDAGARSAAAYIHFQDRDDWAGFGRGGSSGGFRASGTYQESSSSAAYWDRGHPDSLSSPVRGLADPALLKPFFFRFFSLRKLTILLAPLVPDRPAQAPLSQALVRQQSCGRPVAGRSPA